MNKQEKLIWTAGFIDADGTITIKRTLRNGKYYHLPYISCGQSVKSGKKEAIEILKELFGGSIYEFETKSTSRRLNVYQWCITSKTAYECAKTLQKYLIVKKKQSKVLTEFYKIFIVNGGKNLTDQDRIDRDEYYYKMRELNFRGKARLQRLSEKTPKGEATV